METIYYIGLDVHKKTIAYCIKTVGGKTMRQGVVSTGRNELRQWLADLPGPMQKILRISCGATCCRNAP